MKIHPLFGYVLLKEIKEEAKYGIILSEDTPRSEILKGEVVAVGKENKDVKKGDTVLYREGYIPVTMGEQSLHLADEEQILVILKTKKPPIT